MKNRYQRVKVFDLSVNGSGEYPKQSYILLTVGQMLCSKQSKSSGSLYGGCPHLAFSQ